MIRRRRRKFPENWLKCDVFCWNFHGFTSRFQQIVHHCRNSIDFAETSEKFQEIVENLRFCRSHNRQSPHSFSVVGHNRQRPLFPKDSYLGALRLFLRVQAAASASPLIFRRRLGYVRWISISRDPRGAQDFDWVALPGFFCARASNAIAPTRPRFDFLYTEMAASHLIFRRRLGATEQKF